MKKAVNHSDISFDAVFEGFLAWIGSGLSN